MSGDEYESGAEAGSKSGSPVPEEPVQPAPPVQQPEGVVEVLYPWGKRPCFRLMLEGGNKKLVLAEPPENVIDYYKGIVRDSHGCAYDNGTNTFYVTSPGNKKQFDGKLLTLSGNCDTEAFIVADDLDWPSAVAVYEPGRSVCVVTNGGVFVYERVLNDKGQTVSYSSRKVSHRGFYRGVAATAGGGIVTFNYGRFVILDGNVSDGREKIVAEINYDGIINSQLFMFDKNRRDQRSNCCFMDIVDNRLAVSDLQKHVISLWNIEETAEGSAFHFERAIDVAIEANPRGGVQPRLRAEQIPFGKCAFAAGIRQDAEGWVMCADADGRTIQVFDERLNFVTRVEPPGRLPYISGLYIEANGHLMVCDRKNEMGGLRVYMLESKEGVIAPVQPLQQLQPMQAYRPAYFGRPYPDRQLSDNRDYRDRQYSDRQYQGGVPNRILPPNFYPC